MRAFGPPQPDYPGGMGDPISTMKPGAFLRRMNQINVGNDKVLGAGDSWLASIENGAYAAGMSAYLNGSPPCSHLLTQ